MLNSLRIAETTKFARCIWSYFLDNRKGVASVEFAILLALVVVPMFIGTIELNQAIAVKNRVNRVANSIVHLIQGNSSLMTTNPKQIVEVSSELMKPYSSAPLHLTVNGVIINNKNNNNDVCWTYSKKSGNSDEISYNPGGEIKSEYHFKHDNPTDEGDTRTIFIKVEYEYSPIIFEKFINNLPITFEQKLHVKYPGACPQHPT